MLIEIHAIQNHTPANLNRDDLGAPKTCYFGGALRSRISSQCIKRSIRMSDHFKELCGGIRTRQLTTLIEDQIGTNGDTNGRVSKILKKCGISAKKNESKSVMLVYTTKAAITEMAALFTADEKSDDELAAALGSLIAQRVAVPDMALSGRMLETGVLKQTTVEAALQVAHAISTHEARPEVDYYVAADDVPGDDAGAGYVDEALFSSACFYKYFSINWELLVENLQGNIDLAAHTVGAFIRSAALTNPTGKQNSFAAHNPPDALLIEFKDSPTSYANAFAKPVSVKVGADLVHQSIAEMAQYVYDLDIGYGRPKDRLWFSPNLRYPLVVTVVDDVAGKKRHQELELTENNFRSLDALVGATLAVLGCDWEAVRKVTVATEGV